MRPARSTETMGSAPVRRLRDRDRKLVRFERRVDLGLPALGVDDLAEVPLAVEESHADERYPEVARGLQVIAGEHAEAARVDRQDLRQSELGREVRDPLAPRDELAGRGVAGLGLVLLGEALDRRRSSDW